MRSLPPPSVFVVAAVATMLLAAVPAFATVGGPAGCVNVKYSLNGEGLFLWYGATSGIGFVAGSGTTSGAGATFGVLVLPQFCNSDGVVQMTSAQLGPADGLDPQSRIPVLP